MGGGCRAGGCMGGNDACCWLTPNPPPAVHRDPSRRPGARRLAPGVRGAGAACTWCGQPPGIHTASPWYCSTCQQCTPYRCSSRARCAAVSMKHCARTQGGGGVGSRVSTCTEPGQRVSARLVECRAQPGAQPTHVPCSQAVQLARQPLPPYLVVYDVVHVARPQLAPLVHERRAARHLACVRGDGWVGRRGG